jgi:nitrogen fixation-related uncharacterized protein
MDYTATSVFSLYSVMFLFAGGTLFFLYWAIKSGAVKDDESPKYRMMDDELPQGGESHGDQ